MILGQGLHTMNTHSQLCHRSNGGAVFTVLPRTIPTVTTNLNTRLVFWTASILWLKRQWKVEQNEWLARPDSSWAKNETTIWLLSTMFPQAPRAEWRKYDFLFILIQTITWNINSLLSRGTNV